MKTGLVLEGGAMRGMYTCGVLDVLMEQGVQFDCITGVSAGAIFGVNYLSEQKGRAIRYNKKYNSDKNYMGIKPLLKTGNLIDTEFAYGVVPRELDPFDDETYKASNVPFYAVVTNIESGKPEYMRLRSVFDQMDVLRASGSMPFMSKPVILDGQKYLDGGIADSIPFKWTAEEQGCGKLVVILTRPQSYRKTPMPQLPVKMYYKQYPHLVWRLIDRHNMYNKQVEELEQWEKEGKVFVIRPDHPLEIDRVETDPEKLQTVYDRGVADGQAVLEDLLRYLNI